MKDQPIPLPSDIAACAWCVFSRLVKVSATSDQTVRVCKRNPPVPIVVLTPNRFDPTTMTPTVLPSMHPHVLENQWCFRFERAEHPAVLPDESAPKLLGNDGKSILNG